jgi:hypothetical protein
VDSDKPSSSSGTESSDTSSTAASESASATPTPTPTGPEITPPGSKLSFGDSATVDYELHKESGTLDLTVKSAEQGSLKDFKGFDLDDPYKRHGNYFYVRVGVKNAGKGKFGDVAVPLWGISGKGTLLQAVEFKSAFSKCPTEVLPKDFKPGDKFETCLVYLSPNHGSLEGVSYRPTVDVQPIEWHGKVETPEKKKPEKGKKKQKG